MIAFTSCIRFATWEAEYLLFYERAVVKLNVFLVRSGIRSFATALFRTGCLGFKEVMICFFRSRKTAEAMVPRRLGPSSCLALPRSNSTRPRPISRSEPERILGIDAFKRIAFALVDKSCRRFRQAAQISMSGRGTRASLSRSRCRC